MSLVGFKAQNHRQQVGKRGANPAVDDRATTWEMFTPLHKRFHFSIDVAAEAHNAKRPCFYSPAENGLERSWAGERVWCNPPYSSIEPWLVKAWDEYFNRPGAELIVMLLPANRTEQGWWQEHVEPFRRENQLTVEFLAGRTRFIAPGASAVGPNERPPFGCCLLIWGTNYDD